MSIIQKIKDYFYINESYNFRKYLTKCLRKQIGYWKVKSFCASNTSYGWYNFTLSENDTTQYKDFLIFICDYKYFIEDYFSKLNQSVFIESVVQDGYWKDTWLSLCNVYTSLGTLLLAKYDKDHLVRIQLLTSQCYIKEWKENCERNNT